jgi:NADPH:quinone reductase-like Zn-dependent oxidoreductase
MTGSARMRAVSQRAYGGPEVLEVIETSRPRPGPGETLVRVRAAGVNPADWKIRSGQVRRFGDPPCGGSIRSTSAPRAAR